MVQLIHYYLRYKSSLSRNENMLGLPVFLALTGTTVGECIKMKLVQLSTGYSLRAKWNSGHGTFRNEFNQQVNMACWL